MNHGVSAAGENTSYMTEFGNCESLAKIGAVGDNYCNPVTSTDVSTIDIDPGNAQYQDVINKAMEPESCDENGDGCKIKKGSDLAKYISYCANRDSPFAVVDQNILGDLQTSGGLGSWRGIVGAIPLVGDGLDLLDAAQNEDNMPWATGERCGNTANNSFVFFPNFILHKFCFFKVYTISFYFLCYFFTFRRLFCIFGRFFCIFLFPVFLYIVSFFNVM